MSTETKLERLLGLYPEPFVDRNGEAVISTALDMLDGPTIVERIRIWLDLTLGSLEPRYRQASMNAEHSVKGVLANLLSTWGLAIQGIISAALLLLWQESQAFVSLPGLSTSASAASLNAAAVSMYAMWLGIVIARFQGWSRPATVMTQIAVAAHLLLAGASVSLYAGTLGFLRLGTTVGYLLLALIIGWGILQDTQKVLRLNARRKLLAVPAASALAYFLFWTGNFLRPFDPFGGTISRLPGGMEQMLFGGWFYLAMAGLLIAKHDPRITFLTGATAIPVIAIATDRVTAVWDPTNNLLSYWALAVSVVIALFSFGRIKATAGTHTANPRWRRPFAAVFIGVIALVAVSVVDQQPRNSVRVNASSLAELQQGTPVLLPFSARDSSGNLLFSPPVGRVTGRVFLSSKPSGDTMALYSPDHAVYVFPPSLTNGTTWSIEPDPNPTKNTAFMSPYGLLWDSQGHLLNDRESALLEASDDGRWRGTSDELLQLMEWSRTLPPVEDLIRLQTESGASGVVIFGPES